MSEIQEYMEADKWLHWLSQLIAKVNRTYAPPTEDDSHTNIGYDRLSKRLRSRWIDSSSGRIMLVFELTNKMFRLNWLNTGQQVIKSHELTGRTRSAVEFEIDASLEELGLDPEGFTDALLFDIPDYGFKGVSVPRQLSGLPMWRNFRGLANSICNELLEYFQSGLPPRIWPHHFDTAVYIHVSGSMGIGFGLAMADDLVDAPYFYMSGNLQTGGKISYEDLPLLAHGEWKITEDWQGAVWPLDKEFLAIDNPRETLRHFARVAADWYLNEALGKS